MKVTTIFVCILLVVFMIVACGKQEPTAPESTSSQTAVTLSKSTDYSNHTAVLGYAEILTDPLSGEAGSVVWFRQDVGNGQLTHDFVYGDPRRAFFNGGNNGVTFGVKTGFQSGDANLTAQIQWLYDSIYIWDDETCSDLTLSENSISPTNPGIVDNFFQGNGIDLNLLEADLTQVGFLGVGTMFPPGSNTLGVTYTLFWVDGSGNLTDIDSNGKIDIAFREIYYNDQYEWADNGASGAFDLPTVAIHEVGHGFSSAHYGSIGVKDGFLFAKPRAVMNAIYGGNLRDLTGRDRGAHCGNWSQWPNN